MISRLGLSAVAAVGLTIQPRRILLMPVLALNTGASVLVSRRMGEGCPEDANRCMRQFVLLCVVVSALVYGGGFCLARPFMRFSGADADTLRDSVVYFRILMAGQLLQSVSLTVNACLRAAGKTRVSMTTNLAANLMNVVCNYLLIFGNLGFPRWEVAGAAAATALGSLSALLISLWSVRRGAGGVLFLPLAPAAWRIEPQKLLAVHDREIHVHKQHVHRMFLQILIGILSVIRCRHHPEMSVDLLDLLTDSPLDRRLIFHYHHPYFHLLSARLLL